MDLIEIVKQNPMDINRISSLLDEYRKKKSENEINFSDFYGKTILHYACFNEHISSRIIELLHSAGLDFMRTDIHGQTPPYSLFESKF